MKLVRLHEPARAGQEAMRGRNLVCDVRAGIADVPVHLPHDTDVLVAVKQ